MGNTPERPLRIRIGRAFANWLVPEGVRAAERGLRDVYRRRRLVSANRDVLARNVELRDAHRGRRCFILGNGPSLARQDIAPLAGEITFVVNGFWKHPVIGERWQPTYYCLADPNFFDGSEPNRRFFTELRTRCHASTVVLPVTCRRLAEEQALVEPERTRYVAFHGALEDGLRRMADPTTTVPYVVNVVQLAMMLAMYAGCAEIYLLGLDHDWLAHRGEDHHFHAGKTIENHPSSVYTNLSLTPYRTLMEAQLDLWRCYEVLGDFAGRTGTRIYNATDGGFLDVFERARYEDVIARPDAGRARPG